MLRCHYTEPMRARIKAMQEAGKTDKEIVDTIVQQEGVVALAAPPGEGWGLFTWMMPGIALLAGFSFYSWWVRRNRQRETAPVNEADRAVLDRFRDQIESELGDAEDSGQGGRSSGK
jgi:cytochrome c-type biogenesis protein CcmH/NrfF